MLSYDKSILGNIPRRQYDEDEPERLQKRPAPQRHTHTQRTSQRPRISGGSPVSDLLAQLQRAIDKGQTEKQARLERKIDRVLSRPYPGEKAA